MSLPKRSQKGRRQNIVYIIEYGYLRGFIRCSRDLGLAKPRRCFHYRRPFDRVPVKRGQPVFDDPSCNGRRG